MNRNGSGTYDGTAYKAIMGMPKSGEIWTYGSNEKEVLVIKNHGTLCTVLTLLNERKHQCCIEVASRAMKYTDPRMVQYAFNDGFGSFVKALPDEAFDAVLDEIEDALSLNIPRPDGAEITSTQEAYEQAKKKIEWLEAKLAAEKSKPTTSDSIYKQLYDDLIDRLIDRKVI